MRWLFQWQCIRTCDVPLPLLQDGVDASVWREQPADFGHCRLRRDAGTGTGWQIGPTVYADFGHCWLSRDSGTGTGWQIGPTVYAESGHEIREPQPRAVRSDPLAIPVY
ncbi:hypothetical protein BOX15_Mlig025207g1 [Macrostomum lignano]|uniref:Uncharacterized protein n=1 Tax=Macrostomum lignano TaxID=282301 RepID=A0A267GXB6_9PLAT|nr:hypothetical protein BOX15_Mlig025207g1 [Macrostomum lignano]